MTQLRYGLILRIEVSANPQQLQPKSPPPKDLASEKSKVQEADVYVSRETLESIKRTLYNAINKLELMATSK